MIYIFPAGKFSLYNQCLSKNENKCLFTPPLKNIHHWGLFISVYFNLQCLLASSEWAEVAFLFFFFSCLFEIIICWRKRNGWLFQDAVRTVSGLTGVSLAGCTEQPELLSTAAPELSTDILKDVKSLMFAFWLPLH